MQIKKLKINSSFSPHFGPRCVDAFPVPKIENRPTAPYHEKTDGKLAMNPTWKRECKRSRWPRNTPIASSSQTCIIVSQTKLSLRGRQHGCRSKSQRVAEFCISLKEWSFKSEGIIKSLWAWDSLNLKSVWIWLVGLGNMHAHTCKMYIFYLQRVISVQLAIWRPTLGIWNVVTVSCSRTATSYRTIKWVASAFCILPMDSHNII